MDYDIKQESGFSYLEIGEGDNLLLLHGLFGELSNFGGLIEHFSQNYRVVVPVLPLYTLPVKETTVASLVDYVSQFVAYKGYDSVHVVGNSLGGHVGLLFALDNADRIETLTLTGSSGLYENSLGGTFPKRGTYQYIKTKTEEIFYDHKVATKELVDTVFEIVNDNEKVIRILYMARSAIRHNLREELHQLTMPSLLIWGKEDTITPPFVGEEFEDLLPNSRLVLLDKCGHAPMMEKPEEFNQHLECFLNEVVHEY